MPKVVRRLYAAFLVAWAVVLLPVAGMAAKQPVEFRAQRILMVEAQTGTVLLSRNEDVSFTPASLAKLMTLEVVFNALEKGDLAADTPFTVSEYAWRTGGAPSRTSTMFAAIKSQITVDNLLTGVVVHNANDACIILAEGISGSEATFAARMNLRAKELGLTGTSFANSTGLPDAGNRTTARDMIRLAQYLYRTYPDRYGLFSKPDFEWNRIFQRNRNPLVAAIPGVDGLALGFAEDSGFGAVVSAERAGRRLFVAVSGLANDKDRTEEVRNLLEWGFGSFEMREIFADGESVGKASVYGGAVSDVDLVAGEAVKIYVPVENPQRLSARIVYRWPLMAPVVAGQSAGVISIYSGTTLLREMPLRTAHAVEEGTLTARAADALIELLFSWL